MKYKEILVKNLFLILNKESFKYHAFKETELTLKTYKQIIKNTNNLDEIEKIEEFFNQWLDSPSIQNDLIISIRKEINN